MININNNIIFSSLIIFLVFSCVQKANKDNDQFLSENKEETIHNGWWIYGEGQHFFKDEESLQEWDLEFPNENMEELVELYLAICEMEYFPMECEMIGHKRKDVLENQTTLIVSEFNILYIQGCGE